MEAVPSASRQDAKVVGLAPSTAASELFLLYRSTVAGAPALYSAVVTLCVEEPQEADQKELRLLRLYPRGGQAPERAAVTAPHPPAQLWHT